MVDRWFATWSEPETATRNAALEESVAADVSMRDRFSAIEGAADLREHLAAVHRFMPGMAITRDGAVRQCQGMAIADWIAKGADGQERARGTNVFTLTSEGKIEAVTGFWSR